MAYENNRLRIASHLHLHACSNVRLMNGSSINLLLQRHNTQQKYTYIAEFPMQTTECLKRVQ